MAKSVVIYEGKEVSITELAKRFNQSRRMVSNRLYKGWTIHEALNPDTRFTAKHAITYEGKTLTIKEWAHELGINANTLHNRLSRGKWSIKKAFTHKVEHGGARKLIYWKGKLRGSLNIPVKFLAEIAKDWDRDRWEFIEGDERLVATLANGILHFEYNPEEEGKSV